MRITEGNLLPGTELQGVVSRQVSAGGPVDENAARAGAGDEVSNLAKGGSNTAATDPGLTDAGGATGGGRAVPDAGVFENQTSLGDNDSMDDASSSLTAGAAMAGIGNNDDSGAGSPVDAHHDALSASPDVTATGSAAGASQTGGVPTGGMPGS